MQVLKPAVTALHDERRKQNCKKLSTLSDCAPCCAAHPLWLISYPPLGAAAFVATLRGVGCGLKGRPGVYTNVPTYLEWVVHQLDAVRSVLPAE